MRGPSFEQTWIPSTKGCFVPSLVEIGPVVLERRRKCEKVTDRQAYEKTDAARIRWARNNRHHFGWNRIDFQKPSAERGNECAGSSSRGDCKQGSRVTVGVTRKRLLYHRVGRDKASNTLAFSKFFMNNTILIKTLKNILNKSVNQSINQSINGPAKDFAIPGIAGAITPNRKLIQTAFNRRDFRYLMKPMSVTQQLCTIWAYSKFGHLCTFAIYIIHKCVMRFLSIVDVCRSLSMLLA